MPRAVMRRQSDARDTSADIGRRQVIIRQPRSQRSASIAGSHTLHHDRREVSQPPSFTANNHSKEHRSTSSALTRNGTDEKTVGLLKTPPSQSRSSDTRYFTASWGSPYEDAFSAFAKASSSIVEGSYGTDKDGGEDPLSASVSVHNAGKDHIRALTEDWIRRLVTDDLSLEGHPSQLPGDDDYRRSSWISASTNRFLDWAADDLDPRTPTVNSFLKRTGHTGEGRSHNRFASIETVRPERSLILDTAAEMMKGTQSQNAHLHSRSASAQSEFMISPTGKPLPQPPSIAPPPPPRKDSSQTPSNSGYVAEPHKIMSIDTFATNRLLAAPRIRKRIPWKAGRTILVSLPTDDERGQKGKGPIPLTPRQVENIRRDYLDLGYNVRGFDLESGVSDKATCEGRSRIEWPDAAAVQEEREARKFVVSIPDKLQWDAYVAEFQEAKLRSLGVSFADDDSMQAPAPRVPSRISKRQSMRYPALPPSPLLSSSSAGGNYSVVHNVGQPVPAGVNFGAGYGTTSSFLLPPRSSSGTWSPQSYVVQSEPRGRSPSASAFVSGHEIRGLSPSMGAFGHVISPSTPFEQSGGNVSQSHHIYNPHDPYRQSLQHQLQAVSCGLPARAWLRPSDVMEERSGNEVKSAGTQQLNDNHLQKEIDDAEYHLEEQLKRQLDQDDLSATEHERNGICNLLNENHTWNQSSCHQGGFNAASYNDNTGPMLHHPQPHNRGHSLSQQPFDRSSEYEEDGTVVEARNPSLHLDSESIQDGPSESRSHAVKPSASILNVRAPEFKFETRSAFSPSQFLFGATSFQLGATLNSLHGLPMAQPSNTPSLSTTPAYFRSRDNSMSIKAFEPQSREFSFSASSSTFRPSAPIFTPSRSTFPDSIGSNASIPVSGFLGNAQPLMFGNLSDMSRSVTQRKSSRALPIIRPDSSAGSVEENSGTEHETMEGKDGRITQGEGRIKRARGLAHDGDSVPLFAEQPMPLREVGLQHPPSREPAITKLVDKENQNNKYEIDDDALSGDVESPVSLSHDIPMPARQQDHVTVASQGAMLKNKSVFEADVTDHEPARSPAKYVEPTKKHKKSNSSLSALARPFEFGQSWFKFGQSSTPTVAAPGVEPVEPIEQPKQVFRNKSQAVSSRPSSEEIATPKRADSAGSSLVSSQSSSGSLDNADIAQGSASEGPLPEPESFLPYDDNTSHHPMEDTKGISLPSPEAQRSSNGPTFEQIDVVMQHLRNVDTAREAIPQHTVSPRIKAEGRPAGYITEYHHPSPIRRVTIRNIESSSPIISSPSAESRDVSNSQSPLRFALNDRRSRQGVDSSSLTTFDPAYRFRGVSRTPSPVRFSAKGRASIPEVFRREHDPFVEEPSNVSASYSTPLRLLENDANNPPSPWDDMLSQADEVKVDTNAPFFDVRANAMISNVVEARLLPMNKSLLAIETILNKLADRALSRRRELFSRQELHAEYSDADDEEDYETARMTSMRSITPYTGDRKMEKIRSVVMEAFAAHSSSPIAVQATSANVQNNEVLSVLEDMRRQFGEAMRLDLRAEDLRTVVEEMVEKRMPMSETVRPIASIDEATMSLATREARFAEMTERHAILVDQLAELNATSAESKATTVLLDAKVAELIDRNRELNIRLQAADIKTEEEIKSRRAAEDQTAEVQRLLRISSEDAYRLREDVADKVAKITQLEESRAEVIVKSTVAQATLETTQKSFDAVTQKIAVVESELTHTHQGARQWQNEAMRSAEAAEEHKVEAQRHREANLELQTAIARVKLQMEESMHTRESMRGKLKSLQDNLAQAAHDVTEDNARQARKEQELIARQEVLEARLLAESRTRERLEREIERLEEGERQGMRAVNDAKRLETILTQVKFELNEAEKNAAHHKREFEEARESGLSEVERTRRYMQSELESANMQVNIVRQELEQRLSCARAEVDDARLDVDTARSQSEMMLEEVKESKIKEIREMMAKHDDLIEDVRTRHDRELANTIEDARRNEENLLERLSLSTSKNDHLQERVALLEEKLMIAKEAALAAAQFAQGRGMISSTMSVPSVVSVPAGTSVTTAPSPSKTPALPEKISPQALRESIMVLQDQLLAREKTIESLNAQLAQLDPEATTKLVKAQDEILWLRELLSVRRSDLQDIIDVCSTQASMPDAANARAVIAAVGDAAIRLNANMAMEIQECERALSGGSVVQSTVLEDMLSAAAAASPRVAQVVGPVAAAWGNWRSKTDASITRADDRSIAVVINRTCQEQLLTPSRSPISRTTSAGSLSGLLTPPSAASRGVTKQQTAFSNTEKRFTPQQLANRPRPPVGARPVRPGAPSGQASRSATAGLQATPSTPLMLARDYDGDAGIVRLGHARLGDERRDDDFGGSDVGFFVDE